MHCPQGDAQSIRREYNSPLRTHRDFLTYDDDHDLDPDHGDLEVTPEIGDNYLSAEISIPRGGNLVKGRVKSRKRDADGNPIGRADANPILDTREYIVEFEDGDKAKLTANLIASAMYAKLTIRTYVR